MASKRKFINTSFSLYDDLDIGSTSEISSATKPEVSNEQPPVDKKKRGVEPEESATTNVESGVAADRSLISVCGWRKGEREDMQDAHFFDDHFDLPASDIKRSALYAIFDGHAGRKAADFAKEHLPAKLKEKFSACTNVASIEKIMKRTYIDCFKQVDDAFLNEARRMKPSWKDGTTVTTILVINDVLYCANIGDSRAVVCRSKGGDSVVALQLTADHSPLQFDERMRIQKAGGNVKDGRIMGVLEVSRSIGDGQFKAHGVTCIPEIKKFSITPDDRFVLIACDGLWKTFNNKEAVEFVTKELKATEQKHELVEDQPGSSRHLQCERVADALAAEAVKRGCGDNVSVLIILFDNPSVVVNQKV